MASVRTYSDLDVAVRSDARTWARDPSSILAPAGSCGSTSTAARSFQDDLSSGAQTVTEVGMMVGAVAPLPAMTASPLRWPMIRLHRRRQLKMVDEMLPNRTSA